MRAQDASGRWRGQDLAGAAVVVAAALAVALPGITQGGLGWSDAPNHFFDGVFIYEFVRTGSIENVRDWAEQFYLRYPALGIFVYYPPGFAVIEAAVFAVAGVGIAAARSVVLLHMIGAGLLMYALGRRWFDRPTGLFASLIPLTCPHGFLWAQDVMLEWPATFWILAAVYAYERDQSSRGSAWTFALAGAIVTTFMVKQTAGFILPVISLHALLSRDGRTWLFKPIRLLALGGAAAVIAAYLVLTRPYAALPSMLLAPSLDLSGLTHWPAEILGWPLLPIALLGLLTFIRSWDRGPIGLLMLWFVCWTAFSLSISAKEPRYFFFSLPPLAFAAVRFLMPGLSTQGPRPTLAANGEAKSDGEIGVARPEGRGSSDGARPHAAGHIPAYRRLTWRGDAPRCVLLAALVVVQFTLARAHDTGRLPTYAAAVDELARRPDADLVLVDAVRDGQFIFDVYLNEDARRRIVPLRASKLLFARAAREKYAYQQFVETSADIVALLDRYSIRYIVIESEYPATTYRDADPPPRRMLRELLAADTRFKRIGDWPLDCRDPAWNRIHLRLYQYLECPVRTSKKIRLSIPAMGREVEFELP